MRFDRRCEIHGLQNCLLMRIIFYPHHPSINEPAPGTPGSEREIRRDIPKVQGLPDLKCLSLQTPGNCTCWLNKLIEIKKFFVSDYWGGFQNLRLTKLSQGQASHTGLQIWCNENESNESWDRMQWESLDEWKQEMVKCSSTVTAVASNLQGNPFPTLNQITVGWVGKVEGQVMTFHAWYRYQKI